jgi:hypothetical protein
VPLSRKLKKPGPDPSTTTQLRDGFRERGTSFLPTAYLLSNSATHSMCGVWGNMSTGFTRRRV